MTLSVISSKIKQAEKSTGRAIGSTQLLAVSKVQPNERVLNVLEQEHKVFGENKVQELVSKQNNLPKDINWHMIGHLQRNKVKYIAPFIDLIHAVDNIKLLKEINKQAKKITG